MAASQGVSGIHAAGVSSAEGVEEQEEAEELEGLRRTNANSLRLPGLWLASVASWCFMVLGAAILGWLRGVEGACWVASLASHIRPAASDKIMRLLSLGPKSGVAASQPATHQSERGRSSANGRRRKEREKYMEVG